jgi:hypothetical protein
MRLKSDSKSKKQLGIFLVILSMFINIISYTPVFADTLNYSKSLERMEQLGVFSPIEDQYGAFSKGQMMKAVAVAYGLGDTAVGLRGVTEFPDVEPDSELSGYVNAVMAQSFFNGTMDGYLHGDQPVNYEDLCVMLVRMLGYSKNDLTGSYPDNYIKKALDLKLTYEIKFKKQDNVPLWAAVVMFDRALNTNVKGATQTLAKSVNFYDDYIIEDNSTTSTNLLDNEVLTNKGILYLPDSNTKLSAGSTYRLCTDTNNITKVYGTINKTKSIIVDNASDNTVNYIEDNESKSMELPSATVYYYHGVQQNYSNLNSVIKKDMVIVFNYNEDETGFDHAVLCDASYSKPEIALKFDSSSNVLGDINFDDNTQIIKNGQTITKDGIEDLDVVYSVTDFNGNNRYILVSDSRVEGNIKAFISNAGVPTSIKIDDTTSSYSKDMNVDKVADFSKEDKVAALLGYDGKIVDLRKIDYKVKQESEVIILGNSKTDYQLSDNQVLTDKGIYTYRPEVKGLLDLGVKYKVSIDDTTITKVNKKETTVNTYGAVSRKDSSIYYGSRDNLQTMVVPSVDTYYYNGQKIDYNTALEKIRTCSSLILAEENGTYAYGVVIDPIYSDPVVNRNLKDTVAKFSDVKSMYTYREGEHLKNLTDIDDKDVVYTVTDLNESNTFIYVNSSRPFGKVTAILPNRVNPSSIQIGTDTYKVSKDCDYRIFDNKDLKVGSYMGLILDRNGEVIDTY